MGGACGSALAAVWPPVSMFHVERRGRVREGMTSFLSLFVLAWRR